MTININVILYSEDIGNENSLLFLNHEKSLNSFNCQKKASSAYFTFLFFICLLINLSFLLYKSIISLLLAEICSWRDNVINSTFFSEIMTLSPGGQVR